MKCDRICSVACTVSNRSGSERIKRSAELDVGRGLGSDVACVGTALWADGGPIGPSPSIDQAINAGYPWLEIKCSRCKTPRAVDRAALTNVATTYVHDLESSQPAAVPELPQGQQAAGRRAAAVVAAQPGWRRDVTELTRLRDKETAREKWNIFYGDVCVGSCRRPEPRRSMGMEVRLPSWLRQVDRRAGRDL